MDHRSFSPSRSRWYVLQTKPDQESQVQAALVRQHYSCLLPMLECGPMFPRYLFVQLDTLAALRTIHQIEGVTRFLKIKEEIAAVQDILITELQQSRQLGVDYDAETRGGASGTFSLLSELQGIVDKEARVLQLIAMLCQPQRTGLVASPLRKAA